MKVEHPKMLPAHTLAVAKHHSHLRGQKPLMPTCTLEALEHTGGVERTQLALQARSSMIVAEFKAVR